MKRKNKINYKEIFFLVGFMISLSGVAQKENENKDKYLDSLANKIQFQYKKLIFREGTLEAMREIVEYLDENEKYYVVESHTCMRNSSESNQELTDKRAQMMERLFVKIGLDSSKFVTVGYGQDKPCCNIGKTGLQRYKNRRVEIKEISEEELIKLKRSKK